MVKDNTRTMRGELDSKGNSWFAKHGLLEHIWASENNTWNKEIHNSNCQCIEVVIVGEEHEQSFSIEGKQNVGVAYVYPDSIAAKSIEDITVRPLEEVS